MILISDLHHYYNQGTAEEIQALSGANLEIKKGDFLCIIGPNGCGKSTLARHINGLLLPTRGEVRIGELDPQNPSHLQAIRQKVGMVFQNPDRQMVGTIVEEEVAFGPENLGMPRPEMLKRIKEALQLVHLEEFCRVNPQTLSGGQKQRLAIASILAMHPEYIILDEPTSMLDPQGKKEVMKTIKSLNRNEGITVIYITHNLEEAAEFDRVVVMGEGKILMDGPPRQVFSQVSELRRMNLGVPRIPDLFYELSQEGLPLPRVVLTVEEGAEELSRILFPDGKVGEEEALLPAFSSDAEAISAEKLTHIYMKGTPFQAVGIEEVDLKVFNREVLGIVGITGSGLFVTSTTFLG